MVTVDVWSEPPVRFRSKDETIRLVRRVLRGEGFPAARIGIIYLGDKKMKLLNTQFLHHHYTTDVLSFPLSAGNEVLEGEVYVNVQQAKRQAPEFGADVRTELRRLVVHGVLHLAGYDDTTAKGHREMSGREDHYLFEG